MNGEIDPALLHADCSAPDHARRRDGYARLGIFLTRIAAARLRSRPELAPLAEEAAQEALAAVWQKLEAGHGPGEPERFLGWCAAIAIHKVYDALRRQGHVAGTGGQHKRVPPALQTSLDAPAGGGAQEPQGDAWLPDPDALSPESETLDRAAFTQLVLAIRGHPNLSEQSRQVLLRGYLAEATDAELAEALGVSRANVQVIRSRDLAKLRGDAGFVAALRGIVATGR